jgi:hypothetical protein
MRAVFGDYDGDGKTDCAYLHAVGMFQWWIRSSEDPSVELVQMADFTRTFLQGYDVAVPGDFDGDGITDTATWRRPEKIVSGFNTNWTRADLTIRDSSTGQTRPARIVCGSIGDWPMPGYYDPRPELDTPFRRTDMAFFSPGGGGSNSRWEIFDHSASPASRIIDGGAWVFADYPVTGDFDTDGITDIAIYRGADATCHILDSSTMEDAPNVSWDADTRSVPPAGGLKLPGGPGVDRPVFGDYNGDGITEIALYRQADTLNPAVKSLWFICDSTTGGPAAGTIQTASANGELIGIPFGGYSDLPVPGDYDGDGKTELAYWHPSTGEWFIKHAVTGAETVVKYLGVGQAMGRPFKLDPWFVPDVPANAPMWYYGYDSGIGNP